MFIRSVQLLFIYNKLRILQIAEIFFKCCLYYYYCFFILEFLLIQNKKHILLKTSSVWRINEYHIKINLRKTSDITHRIASQDICFILKFSKMYIFFDTF